MLFEQIDQKLTVADWSVVVGYMSSDKVNFVILVWHIPQYGIIPSPLYPIVYSVKPKKTPEDYAIDYQINGEFLLLKYIHATGNTKECELWLGCCKQENEILKKAKNL